MPIDQTHYTRHTNVALSVFSEEATYPYRMLFHPSATPLELSPPLFPPSLPPRAEATPPGLVSAVAGFINLVSSKEPLLELRGCQGIARICYAPPYGCPPPTPSSTPAPGGGGGRGSGHLDEAKAVVALLGGVQVRRGAGAGEGERERALITWMRLKRPPHCWAACRCV